MKRFSRNTHSIAAILMTMAGFAHAPALASEAVLPADVVAQVETSGGFMAPDAASRSGLKIKTDGTVLSYRFVSGRAGVKRQDTQVATLSADKIRDIEQTISQIREGDQLVDEEPNAPMGADFPVTQYRVNTGSVTRTIAIRQSDNHSYILKDAKAYRVRDLLDTLSELARFTRPSDIVF